MHALITMAAWIGIAAGGVGPCLVNNWFWCSQDVQEREVKGLGKNSTSGYLQEKEPRLQWIYPGFKRKLKSSLAGAFCYRGDRGTTNRSSSWSCQGWACSHLEMSVHFCWWVNFHHFQYCPSYFLLSSNAFPKVSRAEYRSTQFLVQQLDPGCLYNLTNVALDRSRLIVPAVLRTDNEAKWCSAPSLTISGSC